MAEILSLSKARKARAKAGREQLAAENRVKFGRTKAEKQLDKARAELDARRVEGHLRDTDETS